MECIHCSKLFFINVTSLAKGNDNVDSTKKLKDESSSTTKTCDSQKEMVIVEEKTNKENDSDDDLYEKEIPRVVEAQVYDDTKKFTEILKQKGKHYLETNTVIYLNCIKGFPNQVS